MKRVPAALLFALTLSVACDKADDKPAGPVDAGPPPEPSTVESTAKEALEVSGTLESKDGTPLQWKQRFSGSNITDLTVCGTSVFGLSDGGRIVEWTPTTLAPKQVLSEFGAVTAIDGNDTTLLAGTADGRLLRAGCDGRDPSTSPDSPWPIEWVHLDPRSKKRAFVVYKESPDKTNKLEVDHASVALVNLETSGTREPFRRPWPEGGQTFGFLDYKGELWFGLTPKKGPSQVWYLERFDEEQPGLDGLSSDVLRGFIQMGREVWSYGGAADGTGSLIYRVDTNRAKPMWDGKEGWFGEQPGGDLPTDPIVAVHKQGKDLVIVSAGNVYRADKELRRWRVLHANDPLKDVLRDVTVPVASGDQILVGTPHGLVSVEGEHWRRATIPGFEPIKEAGAAPATEVTWREQVWTVADRGVTTRAPDSERTKKFKYGPRKRARGMFVDALDRLWVFADDGVWLLYGTKRGEQQRWDTAPIGAAASLIASVVQGPLDGVIILTMSYGAEFGVRVEQPEEPEVEKP